MLTTDTGAESRTNGTTVLHRHLYQLTYTFLVKYLEWINLQYLLVKICWQA